MKVTVIIEDIPLERLKPGQLPRQVHSLDNVEGFFGAATLEVKSEEEERRALVIGAQSTDCGNALACATLLRSIQHSEPSFKNHVHKHYDAMSDGHLLDLTDNG